MGQARRGLSRPPCRYMSGPTNELVNRGWCACVGVGVCKDFPLGPPARPLEASLGLAQEEQAHPNYHIHSQVLCHAEGVPLFFDWEKKAAKPGLPLPKVCPFSLPEHKEDS